MKVLRLGEILIVQLKRFMNISDSVTKDRRVTRYNDQMNIPVAVDDNITNRKSFKLIGSVNHSGSLDRGHYTAHIFDSTIPQWYLCNDSAVIPCKRTAADSFGYILFYKAV